MTECTIRVTREQYEAYLDGKPITVESPHAEKTYIVILTTVGKVFEVKGVLTGNVLTGKRWKRLKNYESDPNNTQYPQTGGRYRWIASDTVKIVEVKDV